MINKSEVKLLEELFLSNYFSYNNLKNIKTNSIDNNLKKIYSDALDVLYDGMDTVLEILDMCGVNK
ncbi:MAG: hypothetical protein J5634_00630 [Bacilli bacterium]|nr:hypothetical protein [Bacilli bacterium]